MGPLRRAFDRKTALPQRGNGVGRRGWRRLSRPLPCFGRTRIRCLGGGGGALHDSLYSAYGACAAGAAPVIAAVAVFSANPYAVLARWGWCGRMARVYERGVNNRACEGQLSTIPPRSYPHCPLRFPQSLCFGDILVCITFTAFHSAAGHAPHPGRSPAHSRQRRNAPILRPLSRGWRKS